MASEGFRTGRPHQGEQPQAEPQGHEVDPGSHTTARAYDAGRRGGERGGERCPLIPLRVLQAGDQGVPPGRRVLTELARREARVVLATSSDEKDGKRMEADPQMRPLWPPFWEVELPQALVLHALRAGCQD
ncbi:MAG TPA: hypothetical protein VK988_21090 [Acidimicrobiales bacterium]|nr:hypothetical protein [Acidimicrobiales bacterium]